MVVEVMWSWNLMLCYVLCMGLQAGVTGIFRLSDALASRYDGGNRWTIVFDILGRLQP